MTLVQSLAAFLLAGGLLTIAPGLDTMLVLTASAAAYALLDRATGAVFIAFGLRRVLSRPA